MCEIPSMTCDEGTIHKGMCFIVIGDVKQKHISETFTYVVLLLINTKNLTDPKSSRGTIS